MALANDGDGAAAGILRLLLGMAAGAPTSAPLPRGSRLVMVQHFIVGDDGDLFSSGVSGGGVPPASKCAIAELKEVKAGEDGVGPLGDCAICLDGVEDAAKEMPCGHQFHGECLERWLGLHGNCPVCRHELPPAAKEEDTAAADGGEERQRPRTAVVVSYLVLAGEREQQQQQQEREEPWTIRIEDVD